MTSGLTAFIDMEFGHVYGTCRDLLMPVELGMVLYDPASNTPRFAGRKFSYDIDVELWRNVTDERGATLGVTATVANLARNEYQKPFLRSHRLSARRIRDAEVVCNEAFADLRSAMEDLCTGHDIETLAFFAEGMEVKAFSRAGFPLDAFGRVDLQKAVMRQLRMKDQLSLDKVAKIIDFSAAYTEIASTHFSYKVPRRLRHFIKPHRALGDAARIFLLSRELAEAGGVFESRAHALLEQYNLLRAGRDMTAAPGAAT
ncbi:hypothetical protein ABH15_02430 [Methanoculleus taiwanensis]|uniref:Exonuclease n=1 Tax=Methanoculleus taiwanensis TaxID=1550565 RepID=A0A498H202_9EURY|nr:hypothetical protein [Methanoculleus taiwanensis]RXE57011.1 hypothetical protein ABH15_02430 [Methanoculleus taiwanensis]